jgi:hypothetical protein
MRRMTKPEPEFRTSSYCGSAACVEVAIEPAAVTCRDTSGRLVTYSPEEWRAFIDGVKAGEFDV